jgi:FlaG/FlaF family flagellin (archaellin)
MTMRDENAVSEVIGAVLLISVVMVSIAVIGVIILSQPPPEKTPKASLTSYCVRCDFNGNYEIILYHGGGEPLTRDQIKFILYLEDGSTREITPWWVYDGTPEDCMFSDIADSSLSSRDFWSSVSQWKSGQTLRFRENIQSKPIGMEIRYYPFRTSMLRVDFKNQIKNSSCVENAQPTSCGDPTDELIPILISPHKKGDPGCNPAGCDDGTCYAHFTYSMHLDSDSAKYVIPSNAECKTMELFYWEQQSITHTEFSNSGNMTDVINVTFFNEVQWWLGRTKSEIARCE